MKGNIYRFRHNSNHTTGYTWAYKIIPKSEIYENICQTCGKITRYPIGEFDVVVEGGSKYPDVLGCGEYPFLIVSEDIINDWIGAGITCFAKYCVGISESKGSKIQEIEPPQYYRIEIDGRCKINLKDSGLEIKRSCESCGDITTTPLTAKGFRMQSSSWDGSDLFRDIELYPRVNFCTEKIAQLAGKNKRTNFRFEIMEGPFDSSSKGIDYLCGL